MSIARLRCLYTPVLTTFSVVKLTADTEYPTHTDGNKQTIYTGNSLDTKLKDSNHRVG